MKDELNGITIDKAYFLGIKQYGYTYKDSDGNRVERSVFSGVKKDSLTFKEIESIFRGLSLEKN